MSAKAKTQLRGNCQLCGSEQAVRNGTMAHHGYTVEHGFFNGPCNGFQFLPMQKRRVETDAVLKLMRKESADCAQRAQRLRDGSETPERVLTGHYDFATRAEESIPWAEADEYQRSQYIKRLSANLDSRSRGVAKQADMLEQLASNVHGTPLREVERDAGPTPIMRGNRRIMSWKSGDRVVVCARVERGRVYYRHEGEDESRRAVNWMGTRSWRNLKEAK